MARTKSAAVTNPGLAKVNKPVKAAVARRQGCPNYKRDLLVKIVGELLPVSNLDWEEVTRVYLRRSGELELREITHIKRFWKHVCCNNNHVPTGETGGPILVAQGIQNQILEKEFCEDYGVPEDFGDDAAAAEEDVSDTEEEAGSGDALTELATQALQLDPAPTPAPAPAERRMTPPKLDNKSKNVRHNPRTSQASTLTGVAKSLEKTAEESNAMKMMELMMMQQNSQQTMMMQLVIALLGRPSIPVAAAIPVASSSSSSGSASASASASSPTSACDFNV